MVMLLLAPGWSLAGDFDDKMGYDDGFASQNEDLKMQTNISYVKQKALQQSAKARREGEDISGADGMGNVVVDGNNYGDITIIMDDVGDVTTVK